MSDNIINIEEFDWNTKDTSWAWITNKYGKLLSYNLRRYHRGYMTCGYQGYITEALESEQYELFIDVGAYIGLFSQIASHYCREVIAYEAHPFYYGILLYNMRFLENVDCQYKFVGCAGFPPHMDLDVKGLVVKDSLNYYNIDLVELDREPFWISNYQLTLIKMDIEGNELNALRGAFNLIKNRNVHWIIDVHTKRGITSKEVLSFFPGRKITMISDKVIKVE